MRDRPRIRLRSPVRALRGAGVSVLLRLPYPLRRNPLFDSDWYLATNADVRDAGGSARRHYQRHGVAEGRDPNPWFQTEWYLIHNPDVRAAGIAPLDHFVRSGAVEFRDPSPLFDTRWYLEQNPDVRRSGLNPLLHYMRHGLAEGRAPRADPVGDVRTVGGLRSAAGMSGRPVARSGHGSSANRRGHDRRIRSWLASLTPDPIGPGTRISVLSGGDDRWTQIPGATVVALPSRTGATQSPTGANVPTATIAQLEWQRSTGSELLLTPDMADGALDDSTLLRRHIERYPVVAGAPGLGSVRDLRSVRGPVTTPIDVLRAAVSAFEDRTGRLPAILDDTPGRVATSLRFPAVITGGPGALIGSWPDGSFDIVVVASPDPTHLGDAQRIATAAVVVVSSDGGAARTQRVGGAAAESGASVSIVIPNYDGVALLRACLASLADTLPPWDGIEVIVVDDASPPASQPEIAAIVAALPRARLIVNEINGGFLVSAARGAAAATGRLLVLLNNDTVLLPGWLEAIVRTFAQHPDAGVVGGRLLYPDGSLQEAGGLVFRDGTAAKYGYGEPDPDGPMYSYLRDTDYVSGALLATPRELFESLGGLDPAYGFGFYEDTDYCFRVREAGRRVLYQPSSTIIHVEGATAGQDTAVGPKRSQVENQRRFSAKWAHVLPGQPARPMTNHAADWYAAALRTPQIQAGRP